MCCRIAVVEEFKETIEIGMGSLMLVCGGDLRQALESIFRNTTRWNRKQEFEGMCLICRKKPINVLMILWSSNY